MLWLIYIIYVMLVIYSFFCSPDVFFKYFDKKNLYDAPEYSMFYIICCVILGLSLLAAIHRIIELINKVKNYG
jgi:hypothetical protein